MILGTKAGRLHSALQGAALFARAYGTGVRVQGWAQGQALWHRRLDLGALSLDEADVGATVGFDVEPLGAVLLFRTLRGHLERTTPGDSRALVPGEVTILAEPDRPYTGRMTPARFGVTALAPHLLARSAGLPTGADPPPLRFHAFQPTTPAAQRHLLLVIAHVRATVETAPEVLSQPLVLDALERLVATAALNTFPSTYVPSSSGPEPSRVGPATLRRAIAFIDANPHRPLAVGDIADQCRVSARALQYAFRHHLQTTPMAYVRRVRLDGVHRDLTDADPSTGATVSAIGARWGFHNPGKLAELYRLAYGRRPRDTLHR